MGRMQPRVGGVIVTCKTADPVPANGRHRGKDYCGQHVVLLPADGGFCTVQPLSQAQFNSIIRQITRPLRELLEESGVIVRPASV